MAENDIKIELLKKNIDRFDNYISTTNAKSSIILAFNGIIVGSIFLKYDVLIKLFEEPIWCLYLAIILLSVLGISSIFSIIFAFHVINPFLESGHSNNYRSMLFFKSISEIGYEKYNQMIDNINNENFIQDLKKQSYQLARGMTKKSSDAYKSVLCIYISLGIIISLLILKGVKSFVNI